MSAIAAAWPRDVALGIRLAVGGGRTSWARLVLGTIGIGLAATVLLVAASVNHILADQQAREAGRSTSATPIPGVTPLDLAFGATRFHGVDIDGWYVHGTGPTSPVPPGLSRLPGPDEIVLSPALARLLASPDGALLRPRFAQRVIGQIAEPGLVGPQDLTFYAGIPPGEAVSPPQQVYSFGSGDEPPSFGSVVLRALVVVGVVALLVPILIMIAISTRIAAAARDRRLAALRLVGAGSAQVRRIAAAETLVPSASGLVLGIGLYLVFREVAPGVQLLGVSVFTDDVVVSWPLAVLIVLLVPLLAVGSALGALRRTVIEPLGVVRGGRPVRRRVAWRVGLVVVGVVMLLAAGRMRADTLWVGLVAVGAALLLLGVPVLLPFLLERGVGVLRGGAPSWQLAIRRLQLDSGTPARVVGGVAVVLAGAIALQTVISATAGRLDVPTVADQEPGAYYVLGDAGLADQVTAAIRRTGVPRGIYPAMLIEAHPAGTHDGSGSILVASCAAIEQYMHPASCRNGDVFGGAQQQFAPGTRLELTDEFTSDRPNRVYGAWTVPASVHPAGLTALGRGAGPGTQLLVTPAAFGRTPIPPESESWTLVRLDPNRPDNIERVRNAVADHPLRVAVENVGVPPVLTSDQKTYDQIRTALLIGSLFTLGLAGVSLLVLALEQVRERRRPLAMLSAAGVPRTVLARSLLWQIAVPVVVGVVAAIGTGLLLAELVLFITGTRAVLDWVDVCLFSVAALVLVLLVTAATLPALRGATRLTALRTE